MAVFSYKLKNTKLKILRICGNAASFLCQLKKEARIGDFAIYKKKTILMGI
jgi:hypothetical protein